MLQLQSMGLRYASVKYNQSTPTVLELRESFPVGKLNPLTHGQIEPCTEVSEITAQPLIFTEVQQTKAVRIYSCTDSNARKQCQDVTCCW